MDKLELDVERGLEEMTWPRTSVTDEAAQSKDIRQLGFLSSEVEEFLHVVAVCDLTKSEKNKILKMAHHRVTKGRGIIRRLDNF